MPKHRHDIEINLPVFNNTYLLSQKFIKPVMRKQDINL